MIESSKIVNIISYWILNSEEYNKLCKIRTDLSNQVKELSYKILTPDEKNWVNKYGLSKCILQEKNALSINNIRSKFISIPEKDLPEINFYLSSYRYVNTLDKMGNVKSNYKTIYSSSIFTKNNAIDPSYLASLDLIEDYPVVYPSYYQDNPLKNINVDLVREFEEKCCDYIKLLNRLEKKSLKIASTLYNEKYSITLTNLKKYYPELYKYSEI